MRTSFAVAAVAALGLTLVGCTASDDEQAAAKSAQTVLTALVNNDVDAVCASTVGMDHVARPTGSDVYDACLVEAAFYVSKLSHTLSSSGVTALTVSKTSVSGSTGQVSSKADGGNKNSALTLPVVKVGNEWFVELEVPDLGDEQAVAETAQKIFTAMINNDAGAYCANTIVAGADPRPEGSEAWSACVTEMTELTNTMSQTLAAAGVKEITVHGAEVSGDRAQLTDADMGGDFAKSDLSTGDMALVKVDGVWYAEVIAQ